MAVDLRRLRPTRRTAAAVVGLAWAASSGAVRAFVWRDLRDGLLRLDGLSRVARNLVRLGFALVFAMVAVLLFNEVVRGSFPLLAVPGGPPGRGQLLPTVLTPLTLFVITVAWSFLITGALHSHWAVRLVVAGVYVGTTIGWLAAGKSLAPPVLVVAAWSALVAVPLMFAVRWRARPRPAGEFAVALVLVAAVYALAQQQFVAIYRAADAPLFAQTLDGTIFLLGGVVTPLLILVGLDIADFTYRASGWAVSLATERLHRWLLWLVLPAFVLWRLRDVLVEAGGNLASTEATIAGGYAGGLVVPVIVALVSWLVLRRSGTAEAAPEDVAAGAARVIPVLAVGYVGWKLLLFVAMFVVNGVVVFLPATTDGLASLERMLGVVSALFGSTTAWRAAFDVSTIVAAVLLVRRARRVLALYLGLVGSVDLYYLLLEPGYPLHALDWSGAGRIDLWWVVALAGLTAWWAARRELTPGRVHGLLLLTAITALMRQTGFIDDPFSPFFRFGAIGIIAFGIAWDALTVGSWANEGTARLPRASRVFLYVGYLLFSVTVINWSVAIHDLGGVEYFTGGVSTQGFTLFGQPMIYAIYGVVVARMWRGHTPLEGEAGSGGDGPGPTVDDPGPPMSVASGAGALDSPA